MNANVPSNCILQSTHPLVSYVVAKMKVDHPTLIFNSPAEVGEENIGELNAWLRESLLGRFFHINGVTFGHRGFRTDFNLVIEVVRRVGDDECYVMIPVLGCPDALDSKEAHDEINKLGRGLATGFGWHYVPQSPSVESDDVLMIGTDKIKDGIKYVDENKEYVKYRNGRPVANYILSLGGFFGSESGEGFTQPELVAILRHLRDLPPKRKYPIYIHSKRGTKYAVLNVGGTKDGNTGESIVHYMDIDTKVKYMHRYDEFFKTNEDGKARFERTDDMIELSED